VPSFEEVFLYPRPSNLVFFATSPPIEEALFPSSPRFFLTLLLSYSSLLNSLSCRWTSLQTGGIHSSRYLTPTAPLLSPLLFKTDPLLFLYSACFESLSPIDSRVYAVHPVDCKLISLILDVPPMMTVGFLFSWMSSRFYFSPSKRLTLFRFPPGR